LGLRRRGARSGAVSEQVFVVHLTILLPIPPAGNPSHYDSFFLVLWINPYQFFLFSNIRSSILMEWGFVLRIGSEINERHENEWMVHMVFSGAGKRRTEIDHDAGGRVRGVRAR
jgi:hypothetical protein